MKVILKAGSTSNILQVFVRDSSSTTGAGLTGLAFNSASLTAYYHKAADTTATVITLATMTVGTFTSSGFKEIDATNMPGWYQFCPPDASVASGASTAFHLKGATNMAPLPIEAQLSAFDLQTAGVTVTTNNDKTGYSLSGTQTFNTTGNLTGNVTGSVGSVTAGVTVTTNNDKTSYALTAGEETNIADALLKRDWTSVTGEASRSVLNALRFLRNKWSIDILGTTVTITKEDNTTSAWTGTIVSSASASPVTGMTGN